MTRLIGYEQKKGLTFDGVADLLNVTPSGTGAANLNPNGNEAFSISAWLFNVQAIGASTQMIFNRSRTTGSWAGIYFVYQSTNSELAFDFSTDLSGTANGVSARSGYLQRNGTVNKWVLVTATYDGSQTVGGAKVYINGEDVTVTQTAQGTPANMSAGTGVASNDAVIGAYSNGYSGGRFNGTMCSVAFWGSALTQAQIKELYYGAGGRPGPGNLVEHSNYTNLVSWWLGDNASDEVAVTTSGTTQTPGTTTIYDSKGSHNMTSTSFDVGNLHPVKI